MIDQPQTATLSSPPAATAGSTPPAFVAAGDRAPCPAPGLDDDKLTEILARIEAIERALFEPAAPPALPPTAGSDAEQLAAVLRQLFEWQQRSLGGQIAEQLSAALAAQQALWQPLCDRLAGAGDMPRSPPVLSEPVPVATAAEGPVAAPAGDVGAGGGGDWPAVIFSPELRDDSQVAPQIEALCRRVLDRDPAASILAGQLLIFQHAPPERRPQLLKDIGEAFYRCCPTRDEGDDNNVFEQSLARWLERACNQAGFQNTIEFVRPGQRFDSTRHLTDGHGGVEIAQVHGWVVLRNRDKVYTKASVSAR